MFIIMIIMFIMTIILTGPEEGNRKRVARKSSTTYIYLYIHTFICINAYDYVCTYIYIYIYICIYAYISSPEGLRADYVRNPCCTNEQGARCKNELCKNECPVSN